MGGTCGFSTGCVLSHLGSAFDLVVVAVVAVALVVVVAAAVVAAVVGMLHGTYSCTPWCDVTDVGAESDRAATVHQQGGDRNRHHRIPIW